MKEIKDKAKQISLKNPGKYVTIAACFGIEYVVSKRLHVFAPSDSFVKSYWLNGIEKPFSNKQIIRDQILTPSMA